MFNFEHNLLPVAILLLTLVLLFVLFFLIKTLRKIKDYLIKAIEEKIDEKIDEKFSSNLRNMDELYNSYNESFHIIMSNNKHSVEKYKEIVKTLKFILMNISELTERTISKILDEECEKFKDNLSNIVQEYEIVSKTICSTIDDFSEEFSKVKEEANQVIDLLAKIKKLDNRIERSSKNDNRNIKEYRD